MEIRSVKKAMRLLEMLRKSRGAVGVSELARQLDLDKATVSRLLNTLATEGFVEQDPISQRYSLGLALSVLGYAALRRLDMRAIVSASLERIVEQTGECAHAAVLVDGRAFYFDQRAPDRGIMVDAPVGTLAPLHCTALGKCLLAFQNQRRRAELIQNMDLEPFTRRTITDAATLVRHLQQVREERVSFDDEELSIGIRCVAAPVFDHAGALSCAFGVSGPSPRVTDDKLSEWAAMIRQEADTLSRRLGYDPEELPVEADEAVAPAHQD